MQNSVTREQIDKILEKAVIVVDKLGEKTTICYVKLENGFEMVESSSCVTAGNYNQELGRKICLERIKNRLWLLEGYRLQCELHVKKTIEEHFVQRWEERRTKGKVVDLAD